ncbi:hypothetical protein MNBD_GAMMA01-2104, partial [hydrothermal vent metagenome]
FNSDIENCDEYCEKENSTTAQTVAFQPFLSE